MGTRRNGTRTAIRLLQAAGFVSAFLSVLALGAGVALAIFSGTQSTRSNTFTAGKVNASGTTLQACSSATVFPTGVFPASSSTVTELNPSGATQAIASGSNTVTVVPLAQAVSAGDTLLIGQGTTSSPASITATASAAAKNATSLTFTTTSTATFNAGTLVSDLSAQNTSGAQVPCQFRYTYAGTVPQYLAVDVFIVSGDSTHAKLWDPTAAGLELSMTDQANNVYTLPIATTSCSSGSPFSGVVPAGTLVCGIASDDVLNTSAVSSGTFTLTLDWGLPTTAPSADQGGNTTVFVLFHAVQSAHNTLGCTTTPTKAGQPCAPSGGFSWS